MVYGTRKAYTEEHKAHAAAPHAFLHAHAGAGGAPVSAARAGAAPHVLGGAAGHESKKAQ
jgi:hypothetical protein